MKVARSVRRRAGEKGLQSQYLVCGLSYAPGNRQSGGKRLKAHTTKGNARLRAALAEVVWVISRTKDNYLSAQYHRLVRRIGQAKAIVAVSHSVLVIIYSMLRDQKAYSDLGSTYFETLDQEHVRTRAVRQLQALGYTVTLQTAAPQEESA